MAYVVQQSEGIFLGSWSIKSEPLPQSRSAGLRALIVCKNALPPIYYLSPLILAPIARKLTIFRALQLEENAQSILRSDSLPAS
jgi:hypothetical protein